MDEAIFKLAANIGSPLALAGITVAIFCRIILAIINAQLFSQVDSDNTAQILKRVVRYFFVLSLVAAILGLIGWIYAKSTGDKRRTTALESFSHLVTTLRTESERLMIEYPIDYRKLISDGCTPEEAKQHIAAAFRQRIDTTVAGDKLGSQMRLGFPEYPWGFFLQREKPTSGSS